MSCPFKVVTPPVPLSDFEGHRTLQRAVPSSGALVLVVFGFPSSFCSCFRDLNFLSLFSGSPPFVVSFTNPPRGLVWSMRSLLVLQWYPFSNSPVDRWPHPNGTFFQNIWLRRPLAGAGDSFFPKLHNRVAGVWPRCFFPHSPPPSVSVCPVRDLIIRAPFLLFPFFPFLSPVRFLSQEARRSSFSRWARRLP